MPHDRRDDEPGMERFIDRPTRDLGLWEWLWTEDRTFPVRSHRGGLVGRALTFFKRLARPLVKTPLGDLWDRQRTFNLILLEVMQERHSSLLQRQQEALAHQRSELSERLDGHAARLDELDARATTAMYEAMRHNDALFARVDQKLDRYRRESRELFHRLGAFIAAAESAEVDSTPLAVAQREQEYLGLEQRYRGSEAEIAERVAVYLPYLEKAGGDVVDLGCGRGEALAVLGERGIPARGVDESAEMVERCREQGLDSERGDLFEYLAGVAPGSLGGVVSFHVVEHLPPASLGRLVRLAWQALRSGGVLVLETPSPLSMTMAARDFWIDPTHLRPVHPASLEVTLREAGFEPVFRLDLHPYPDDARLPEIDLGELPEGQRALADRVNRLRDILDDLLFGHRDYGIIGIKA